MQCQDMHASIGMGWRTVFASNRVLTECPNGCLDINTPNRLRNVTERYEHTYVCTYHTYTIPYNRDCWPARLRPVGPSSRNIHNSIQPGLLAS